MASLVQSKSILLLIVVSVWSLSNAGKTQEPVADLARSPEIIGSKNRFLIVSRAEVPQYPVLALGARISGEVRIKVSIKAGEVVDTQLVSSAHMLLSKAAIENVKTWHFLPEVTQQIETTFLYEIEKVEGGIPQNPRIEMELPSLVRIRAMAVRPTVFHSN